MGTNKQATFNEEIDSIVGAREGNQKKGIEILTTSDTFIRGNSFDQATSGWIGWNVGTSPVTMLKDGIQLHF